MRQIMRGAGAAGFALLLTAAIPAAAHACEWHSGYGGGYGGAFFTPYGGYGPDFAVPPNLRHKPADTASRRDASTAAGVDGARADTASSAPMTPAPRGYAPARPLPSFSSAALDAASKAREETTAAPATR